MGLTVSPEFLNAWANKSWRRSRRDVRIKRRYFDAAASPTEFIVESDWTTLAQKDIASVGAIPQAVDTEFEAIFQITTFSIELASPNGEWLVDVNPPSFFASDAVSAIGYEAIGSLVEIDFVLELLDGTEAVLTVFSGVINDDPQQLSNSITARVSVTSNAYTILNSDAENVSDLITLEDCIPAVGDGVETEFLSTSEGVAFVSDLQKAGLSLLQGKDNDWTVTQIGEDLPAKFKIESGVPGSGVTMKWSGRIWKQQILLEDFINAVLDNASFPVGKREISPITFPGGLSGSVGANSQADWEDFLTEQSISTTEVPGSIVGPWEKIDIFEDGNFISDPVWTEQGGTGEWSISGTPFKLVDSTGTQGKTLSTPETMTNGAQFYACVFSGFNRVIEYFLMLNHENPYSVSCRGYVVSFTRGSFFGGGPGRIQIQKFAAGAGGTRTSIGSGNQWSETSGGVVIIDRTASGVFNVYVNGTLRAQGTDNTYTTTSYIAVGAWHGASGSTVAFGKFYRLKNPTAIIELEFNLLAAPDSWGILEFAATLNGGTVIGATAVADDVGGSPGSYSAYVDRNIITFAIESALKQWLRIRLILTPVGITLNEINPQVDSVIANFVTSQVFISVANLQGLDNQAGGGWAAIERYLAPTGYAMLIRGDGNFAVRPRNILGATTFDLTQSNSLIEITAFESGALRVRNVGRVRYAGYKNEYDGVDASESEPTSEQRYGRVAKEENFDNILYANDVNLGQARATVIYETGFRKRRRWRFRLWIVPWLEVLDTGYITFLRDPAAADPIYGDPLFDGTAERRLPIYGTPSNPLFVQKQLVRILAWTPNVDILDQCSLYVEEIFDDE